MRLIIATKNKGKLKEIKKILKGVKLEIVSLAEVAPDIRIKENGKTFYENALKKTKPVAQKFPEDLVVGEDSGIEVTALDNRPGIYSKRYSGKNATDNKNNLKILKELEKLPRTRRKARFRCVLTLMKGRKMLKKCEGVLSGYIHTGIEGKNGFGYDPVMYLPAYKKTVAQLPVRTKNTISHRYKAFAGLKKYLVKYLKNQ